jgi:hypothetical protein
MSAECVGFLLRDDALLPYIEKVKEADTDIVKVETARQGKQLEERLDNIGKQLELMIEIVSNLKIEDATQTTRIIDSITAIFSTRDLKLASILTTLGFEFENAATPASRIKRESGEESTVFHFLANHPTSGQTADEVMRAFAAGEDYIAAHQDEPLAYMLAVLRNRDELVSVVKQTPRQVVFERNGKIISISENATEADKKRFAKFM